MKKTVIINISGIVFHIDEDAYEKLQRYLDSLGHYFGKTDEGMEIVTDIESRIAELLQPKVTENKQSVAIEDIDEILAILGTPEDIAASDSANYEETSSPRTEGASTRSSRRLYRDVENSAIGGVCSGFAAYFDVDPIFFRILFIALIFAGGISFILYPILWIAVPAARTSGQKLEMRGKDITLSNIEKTVREEFSHIKKNMDKPDSFWSRIMGFFNELFMFMGTLLRGIFGLLRYLLGMILILMAISFIIGIIGALYFKNFSIHGNFNEHFTSVQDFLYNIVSPINADTLIFLLFVVLILPIIGMIYSGLKLLIRFKANDRWVVLTLAIFWIASVIAFTVLIFNEVKNFNSENSTKEIINLASPSKGVFYLNAPAVDEDAEDFISHFNESRLFIPLKYSNKEEFAGITQIDIEKTTSLTPELQIIREARGDSRSEALESAKKIKVNYSQKDTLLTIDPFFRVSNDERWKFYNTKIIIRLPVGVKIFLNENTRRLLHNVKNRDDYWDDNMVNKTWIMTENGLELVGSSDIEIRTVQPCGNRVLNLQIRDRYSISQNKLYEHNDDHYGPLKIDGEKINYGTIKFDVRKSDSDKIYVELIKSAAGNNSNQANAYSRAIEYTFDQNDSVLWLDPIFRFPENNRWNDQKLKVILRVPIRYHIYFSKEMEPLLRDFADDRNRWAGDFINNTWEMANEGLVKIEEQNMQ